MRVLTVGVNLYFEVNDSTINGSCQVEQRYNLTSTLVKFLTTLGYFVH